MTVTFTVTSPLTITAADIIIDSIESDLASLNAVGCRDYHRDYHNDQTILDWSNRIAAQIECVAILIGKDNPTVENLEIDLGRAITKAGANLKGPDMESPDMESFDELLNRLEKNRAVTTHATCPIHDLAYDPEHWSCCERCWENLCVEERLQKALRHRIEIAIDALADLVAGRVEDCRFEHCRIMGMIHALSLIGGDVAWLWAKAQRAECRAIDRSQTAAKVSPV